ncbi:hypothetical protein KTO58_16015 [Chitinophaga pendula]|uniref:HU domain-containing protein n=1 Tax=Chitinophaga TaxID=79328 RepID=UPI000BB03B8A|nr:MULTISPECIES: hypothetical protein [Chitinophaga]ASZ11778.1 hypothetical protein CK934_12835 [Chitinophaga sp. MD30]UCJ05201.1 hypothetical protein KTO58_16015 [Chitinophaga pendula]
MEEFVPEMILLQYIQDVLTRQQVCCLPHIGTFTLQHIPSRYNVVDHTITPPGQTVTFENKWTDDGSCAEWIASKENLVPAVAQRKLDKYTDELKATLLAGQSLIIPGIGSLKADAMQHIYLEPEVLPEIKDDILLRPVIRADQAPPKITRGTTEVVAQQVVEHLTPVQEEPPSTTGFRWWWIAAPLATALIALIIWWVFAGRQSPAPTTAIPATTTPTTTPADTMNIEAGNVTPDSAGTTTTATAPSDTLQYFVVFAAYADSAKAGKQYHKLKELWGQNVVRFDKPTSATPYQLAVPFRSLPADTTANKAAVAKHYAARVHIEFE